MGFVKSITQLLMPTLAVLGFFSTVKFASDNGLFDQILHRIEAKSPRLPDSSYYLKTNWTGVPPLDRFFSSIVVFFYPCIDGGTPNLTLNSIHFLGQLASAWVLLLVESFRVGNYWKIVSFITIWGLLIENVAMAFILPVYFSLHLLTSPTGLSPGSAPIKIRKASLLVHPVELQVIPWAVLIALGAPVALTFLTRADVLEPLTSSQQFWIVVRNFHPIYTAGLILVLSMFARPTEVVFESAEQRNRNVLRALQGVHAFAIYLASIPHIATTTLVILARVVPMVFARKYQALFDPKILLSPTLFWADPQPKAFSVSHGATIFLQWDEAISCAAVLLWAWAVNREAISTDPTAPSLFSTLWKTIGMVVVGGPAAAAVYLISEKDQVILDGIENTEPEKRT